ncbi:MAG: hypothetical protein Kow00128_19790 [Deltaproteobacteria bacterium]
MLQWKQAIIAVAVLSVSFLPGCGGGGSSESGPTLPPKTLSWAPPSAYTDGTPLNPITELDGFEIYMKENGPFTNADAPRAWVKAVDPATGQLVTNFNLAKLEPFINLGVQYQVALKAVTLTGASSDFSAPATFSF